MATALACHGARSAEADDWADFPPSVAHVNEGKLVFLAQPPEKSYHIQRNHIVIAEGSLWDGWVELHQCHDQLDAVSRSQVVFNRERTRDLRIVESNGIGSAWVENNTVQLKDTGRGAHLCVSVMSRALERQSDGSFTLRSGPFMRRFLDGYYPMHVLTRVTLATPHLTYMSISPEAQPGFRVWQEQGEVFFDAMFEGRLNTRLSFRNAGSDLCP